VPPERPLSRRKSGGVEFRHSRRSWEGRPLRHGEDRTRTSVSRELTVCRSLEGLLASPYAPDVTKLAGVIGGVIGAVLGFLLTFVVGDHIAWVSRQSDTLGNAVAVVVAVGGWVVGSRIARRLTARPTDTPSGVS
jgi:hypothetical protein